MRRFYFDRMGQVNGTGPVLFMLCFLRPDGGWGGCQCVEQGRLQSEIMALQRMGWVLQSAG